MLPPMQRFIIGVMARDMRNRKRMVRLYRSYVALSPGERAAAGEPRQRGFRGHAGLFLMLMARDRLLFMLVMPPLAITLYLFVILH